MSLELRELLPAAYAEYVLPHTHALWGHGRPLDAYVAQTTRLAQTAYGRKSFRTLALTSGDSPPLASFKRYEREAAVNDVSLRCIGIGAVFTPQEHRGRGYASAMLGMALDGARRNGFDFAYLFSDIHPQFYKELGFHELPSRTISMRADALSGARVAVEPLTAHDWTGVRKCFDATFARRGWGLARTPSVWDWVRIRMDAGATDGGQPVHLLVRKGRSIAAYVLGRREPAHDAYVLDEFGYAGESAEGLIAPVLRAAAGDLRRVVGWLPPAGARELLPRGSVRRRNDAIWMIAPLSANGTRFLERAQSSGPADGIWSLDHI